jgi:proteic killer suppression protein
VKLRNFRHKGLGRLYAENNARGLPAGSANKLRNMMAFLQAMKHPDELRAMPTWKAHLLSGDRAGLWSLHVTRNWRLTFWIDNEGGAVYDLDFEDYH